MQSFEGISVVGDSTEGIMPIAKRKSGKASDDILIVCVPYGTREVMLSEGKNPPKGLMNDAQRYTGYLRDAICDIEDSTSLVRVYPPNRDDEALARRDFENLSERPVVYVAFFEQGEGNHSVRLKALESKAVRRNANYKAKYVVYVGETNDIVRRTDQHLIRRSDESFGGYNVTVFEEDGDYSANHGERFDADSVIQKAVKKDIDVKQLIVWDTYFTKSMTLDIENKFIDYFMALDDVYLLNGRGNPQRSYYKSEEMDRVCSALWQKLSLFNEDLFPPEADIWNSDLYKISPFHSLSKEQSTAVNDICDVTADILENQRFGRPDKYQGHLIVVEGASGTGKSIVLSTLFVRLSEMIREIEGDGQSRRNKVALIVNNEEQLALYKNLAIKVGLMRTLHGKDRCVFRATEFIHLFNPVNGKEDNRPDVVLVDEAHLLYTQNVFQAYNADEGNTGNQLHDILLSAKVVIAVFDPEQCMKYSQVWPKEELEALLVDPLVNNRRRGSITSRATELRLPGSLLNINGVDSFDTRHIRLTDQFRMDACPETIEWIDRLADTSTRSKDLTPIPEDDSRRHRTSGIEPLPYDIRVYSSPFMVCKAIDARAREIEEKHEKASKGGSKLKQTSSLCRVLATYDWSYSPADHSGSVDLYLINDGDGEHRWTMPENGKTPQEFAGRDESHFSRPWNYAGPDGKAKGKKLWASDSDKEGEVGSYFSIQGFDLNYAGVIIGPSIRIRDGRICVDASKSTDNAVRQARGELRDQLVMQQLKVLLRRGIHGLYLFAVDPELQRVLEDAARESGKLDLVDW